MQDERAVEATSETAKVEAPTKDWRKPTAEFVPVRDTMNSPGGWPDAGINYS
ncbi:MAG: hypothetical protein ACK4GG_02485 [Sphingomonas sp.]|uniref:hypothetical protein n=1 Tax=Sphingomonas sp. TaxID=28214 RepID=UPI002E0FA6B9|nr:hypothetical protein [Sphingomonas sp.]